MDVLWTPTHPLLVEAMLDMANLQPSDVLIDLGSGDGRILIAAAKRGVRAIGIELDTQRIQESRALAREAGVAVEIRQENFLTADLSVASVITCFLDRPPHRELRRRFASLRPSVRIISNTFELWEHDAEFTIPGEAHFHTARLYTVS